MPNLENIKNTLKETNTIIKKHNEKSNEFESRQEEAIKQIKGHYFSTIKDNVTECLQKIASCQNSIDEFDAQKQELEERIANALDQISSSHKACADINQQLHSFLGRQELTLSPADETNAEDGYQILRNGKPAKHLSEGEKTAVALIYFLVNLHDGQTDIKKTIVVIDDPISSLDSNSLYQAFSFLKNRIKDCHQIFILTHSFSFLRLLLNWRARKKKGTGYFMIKNEIWDGARQAKIVTLDQTLKENETEYLFLFKTLNEFLASSEQDIAVAYPIPNLARKFWENFLVFFIPSNKNMYARMGKLKKEGFDSQKLDAIYKFTNDQSHITGGGFDPSLVPEARLNVKNIFDVIEQVAPRHYNALLQCIDSGAD